jgi:hypothetical protein
MAAGRMSGPQAERIGYQRYEGREGESAEMLGG